jgi:serine/threonine protein kinase
MELLKDVDFTGRTIDRYAILALIRAGGQGRVYRGRDDVLRREVAVKVLNPEHTLRGCSRAGLITEARALSRLTHQNVAAVYDFVTQDAREFLVMEFIAGATLEEVLAGGPLPPTEVLRLGSQLARGLGAIHAAHIAHCDIKPGNLKIASNGVLKIVDFGLARQLSSVLHDSAPTTGLTLVGTFPYMAPEVLCGEAPDQRSDVFSAGAVLYEMATGGRAFPQQTLPALVHAIEHNEPVAPSRVNPAVPVALDRVVLTALQKLPVRRYQTGAELARALDALSPGRRRKAAHADGIQTHPSSSADGKQRWWRLGGARERVRA